MSVSHIFKVFAASLLTWLAVVTPLSAEGLTDPEKTYDISISLKKPTIAEFTQTLSGKLGIFFSFNSSLADQRMADVSIQARQKTLEQILSAIFSRQQGFSYQIITNTVLLFYHEVVPEEKPDAIVGGLINDIAGHPIPGVAIRVRGTDRVAVSDSDGNYVIKAEQGDELIFSSVGFSDLRAKVEETNLSVVMSADPDFFEPRIQVGYGIRKTDNLTGSVASVNSDRWQSRPFTDLLAGLQALLPGVSVISRSGQPGASGTQILVRGLGTTGYSAPLLLIDGIQSDFSNLNPDDIENITVLKDAATAAIYGMRAANGVILVTTRRLVEGSVKGSTRVSFGAYAGLQLPERLPQMCNALEFMELDNEARRNTGAPELWQPIDFEQVRNGASPNLRADTDWVGSVMKKMAAQQNYSLNVDGSVRKTAYSLSYRYLDQDGLTTGQPTGNNRHNVRFKINSNFLDRVNLLSNFSYINDRVNGPVDALSERQGPLYDALRVAPVLPMKYTDGTWASNGQTNPAAVLQNGGYTRLRTEELSLTEVLRVDILTGWSIVAGYHLTSFNGLKEQLRKTIHFRNPLTGESHVWGKPNEFRNEDLSHLQQEVVLKTDFDVHLGRRKIHKLSGMFGLSQEWFDSRSFFASRRNVLSETNPSLHLGDQATMTNDSASSQWAMRSGFGRLNYNYDNRYIVEMNFRYDLSSRFPKKMRGGFFPSVSGAWRISEEKFMEPSRKVLDNLKIRASWGVLGNQYVGTSDYPYISVLKQFTGGSFIGSQSTSGYSPQMLDNPGLTWEKARIFNVGLDLSMFRDRFSFTFDWFNKDTDGMLVQMAYPDQLGALPSLQNGGKMNNRGWELNFGWKDHRGEFSYGAGFHLSDVRNRITDLAGAEPLFSGPQVDMVGYPAGAIYGYVADGLLTPADFASSDSGAAVWTNPRVPVIPGQTCQPGDIRYKDISGPDGQPDGIISPEYDRTVLGNLIPRLTYAIHGNLAWKGLDFSILLQGVGKCDGYLSGPAAHAFHDGLSVPQKKHLSRYQIGKNPDPAAAYPRLTYGQAYNQDTVSSFWLQDASYFKVRNVQIGYTFPEKWMKKARIDHFRLYLSGDNLATVSRFDKAYDPEVLISAGGHYPQVRTVVIGLNITFK